MAPVCSILELPQIDMGSLPEWRTIYCFVLRVNLQLRPKAPDVYHVTDFTCNSQIAAGRPAVMVHDTPIDDDQVFTLDVFRAKTTKICDAYQARTGMPLGLTQMIVAQRTSTRIADRMLLLKVDVSLKLFNGVLECRTGNIEVVAKNDPSPYLGTLFYNMCRYLPAEFFTKLLPLSEMIIPERYWQEMYTDQPRSQVEKFAQLQRAAQGQAARDAKVHAPPLHLDSEHRGDLVSSPLLEREDRNELNRGLRRDDREKENQEAPGHIAKRLRSNVHHPKTSSVSGSRVTNVTNPNASGMSLPRNNEPPSTNTVTARPGAQDVSSDLRTAGPSLPSHVPDTTNPNRLSAKPPVGAPMRISHNISSESASPSVDEAAGSVANDRTASVSNDEAQDSAENHNTKTPTSTGQVNSNLWTVSELARLADNVITSRIYNVRARLAGTIPQNWSFICPKLYEFSPIAREYVLTDPRPRGLELILVDENVEGPLLGQDQYLNVYIPGCDIYPFFEMTSIENFYVASESANRYYQALLARPEPFTISLVRMPSPDNRKHPIMVWLPHNCTIDKLLNG